MLLLRPAGELIIVVSGVLSRLRLFMLVFPFAILRVVSFGLCFLSISCCQVVGMLNVLLIVVVCWPSLFLVCVVDFFALIL